MPMQFSDWSVPFVPVIMADENICVFAKPEFIHYPEWMIFFTALSGSTLFSKLDLSHAYQQLKLDEESKTTQTLILLKASFNTNSCHLAYPLPRPFFGGHWKV